MSIIICKPKKGKYVNNVFHPKWAFDVGIFSRQINYFSKGLVQNGIFGYFDIIVIRQPFWFPLCIIRDV